MTGLQKGDDFQGDTLHEECGVFGIFGHPDAGALTVLGLHALQHRGQEAAGIVTYDQGHFTAERHPGLVGDIFGGKNSARVANLRGAFAIGHNRYSTAGGSGARNIQPMFADLTGGGIALAHNGNLTNARTLRTELVGEGRIFQSTSDTEVIIHLAARSTYKPIVDKLIDALKQVEGAYSLVALTSKKLIGVRDPWGVRPLVLGKLDTSYILASETCALDIIGAEFVRDIEPGELVVITKDGLESYHPFAKQPHRLCVFEYIYFSRPDSVLEGRNIYEHRKRTGVELAREALADADMVIPVPDSSIPAAIGYANEAKLPFELGIIRNHYVGRTFIEPTDGIRNFGVKKKHNPNRATLAGKRVVLIDDSIVRGTTSKKIVQMVRDAGAAEVHFRVASPPTAHSCFYGVDTPNTDDLLGHRMDVEEMRRFIGADSLAFISMDGLYRAMGEGKRNAQSPQFCDACFSGAYPIELTDISGGRKDGQLSLLADVAVHLMARTLEGRIALVTGVSRGLGRASAIALAAAGAHVVCVARTTGALEEVDDVIQKEGGSATLVPLDIRDFDALDRLGRSLYERWGRLDAFLGNAGSLGVLTPLTHLQPKVFQELIEVNVTANWRLIRSLDPLLRASDAGRVLFVSSGAARKHTPFWGGYGMVKAALELLTLTYAAECETTPIRVNLFNPGAVRTAMRARAMPGEDPDTLPEPDAVAPLIVELLSPANTKNGELVAFKK